MARPQIAPVESPLDREQQLRFAEQEVATHEAQLTQEVARLQSVAGELLGRLQHIRAAASQAQLSGVRDAGFAELHKRVHQTGVPQVDVTSPYEAALKARAAAVDARRKAVEQIHQSVQTHATELSRLSSQLTADETAMTRFEAQAREAAAAQRREMEPATLPMGAGAPHAGMPSSSPGLETVPARPMAARAAGDSGSMQVQRPQGRRALSRVRMQAAVDLHSDSNFFTGFSTNISEGGLFVATVECPPLGTEIDLSFTLPGGRKVTVKGVVRWAREVNDRTPEIFPGVGIQFVDLDGSTAEVIHHFVSEREPMFFPE